MKCDILSGKSIDKHHDTEWMRIWRLLNRLSLTYSCQWSDKVLISVNGTLKIISEVDALRVFLLVLDIKRFQVWLNVLMLTAIRTEFDANASVNDIKIPPHLTI